MLDHLIIHILKMITNYLRLGDIYSLKLTSKIINQKMNILFNERLIYKNYPVQYLNSGKNNYIWAINNGLRSAEYGIFRHIKYVDNLKMLNLFRSKNLNFVRNFLSIFKVNINLYVPELFKSGFVEAILNPSSIGINCKINYYNYTYEIYKFQIKELYHYVSEIKFKICGIVRSGNKSSLEGLNYDYTDKQLSKLANKSGSRKM